jgi:hypothetical protein
VKCDFLLKVKTKMLYNICPEALLDTHLTVKWGNILLSSAVTTIHSMLLGVPEEKPIELQIKKRKGKWIGRTIRKDKMRLRGLCWIGTPRA